MIRKKSGIEQMSFQDFFDTYYKGRNKAVAYKVENVKKYIQPKTLEDFGVSHAPQSFVYV